MKHLRVFRLTGIFGSVPPYVSSHRVSSPPPPPPYVSSHRVSSPVRQFTSGQFPSTSAHIGSVPQYVSSHRVSSPVRQLTSGQFPSTSAHIGSVPQYVSSHRVSSPVRQLTNNWRRGRIAATGLSEKCKRPPYRCRESGGWRRGGDKVGSVCVAWGGVCVCVA